MDTELLRELLPHYVVMVVLAYAILTVANELVGTLNFWVELVVIIVVFFAYRIAIVRSGYGPEIWE